MNVGSVPLPTHLHYLQALSPPLPSQPHGEEIGFLETAFLSQWAEFISASLSDRLHLLQG